MLTSITAHPLPTNCPNQWVWMTCGVCNHATAESYGIMPGQLTLDDMRARGWCTVCGSLGQCLTYTPSWDVKPGTDGTPAVTQFDPDLSRATYLENLARSGKLRFMIFDSVTRTIVRDRLTLAHAVSKMIRLSGFVPFLTNSWKHSYLAVLQTSPRAKIGDVKVSEVQISRETRWTKLLSQVARGDLFQSRYRVITDDFYRMALCRRAPE